VVLKKHAATFFVGLLGVLVGVALALFISRPTKDEPTQIVSHDTGGHVGDHGDERIDDDLQQVEQAHVRQVTRDNRSVTPSAPPIVPLEQLSPEEREHLRQEQFAMEADALRAHDSESVDKNWASAMEQRIGGALNQANQDNFTFDRVDCRSQTCTVTLQWKSAEIELQQRGQLSALLHLPCTTRMHAPDIDDAGVHSKLLVFGCT
jgi:hypothetical protein